MAAKKVKRRMIGYKRMEQQKKNVKTGKIGRYCPCIKWAFAGIVFIVGGLIPVFGVDQGTQIDLVQSESSKVVTLSLKSYIELASAADRTFQGYLIDGAKAKYSAILVSPSEDIVVSAAVDYGLNFLDLDKNDGFTGSVGLSKLFASTGTELSAKMGFTETSSTFSFSAGQDIVKNAFGKQGRWQKELAGISLELAEYQTVEAYEDYFAEVAGEWYKWVALYQTLTNSRSTYNESLLLYNLVAKKRKSGIASQSDLNRSYLQLISANSDIIAAQEAYDNQELVVKLSAGIGSDQQVIPDTQVSFPFSSKISGDIPGRTSTETSSSEALSAFENYDELIGQSRTGKMLNLLTRSTGIDLQMARDDLLPSVKLNLGYNLGSGTDFDYSTGNNGMTFGLSLSYSVWSKHDRATYSIAQLEEDQNKITVADTQAKLEVDLRQLHISIFSLTRRLELAKTKVSLLEQIYRESNNQYNTGRLTLNNLVSDIEALSQARYSLSLLYIELEQFQLEWLRLTDQLVTEMSVLNR